MNKREKKNEKDMRKNSILFFLLKSKQRIWIYK